MKPSSRSCAEQNFPRTLRVGPVVRMLAISCLLLGPNSWLTGNHAWAQTHAGSFEGRIITEIQVSGNSRILASTILAKISSQTRQPYRAQTINQDIKAIQRLRGIQAVYVSVKPAADKLVLIFQIVEEPLLGSVELSGNRRFDDDELAELLALRAGDFADAYLIARGTEALADHYRQTGYHRVQITADGSLLDSQGKVVYRIVEGPRTRVRKIIFEGNQQVSSGKLRSKILTKPHILILSAGNLDSEQLERDVSQLGRFLREKGYLDAQVGKRLDFSSEQDWVTIIFLVKEGPLYQVRQIRFVGNENISTENLLDKLKIGPGDVPVHSAISFTNTQQILETYGRQGYVDAQVQFTPIYLREEPGLVDLTYKIVEGSQFRIGNIDILGNEITQDRVVRRQLLLAPGDIYDSSKMQRSRRRLLESMLFDQVEISHVSGPGLSRDVKISVAERPTAMLLMGVGVTSDAGVVGDFSFIQRNFDLFNFPTFRGAGQYFRLQAQPGSELTRFSVDFREPYVADLPISFGQSIYLRGRVRDYYDEDRLGALWSLGTRFWDGWEIEGAIRLEEVTIRDIDDDLAVGNDVFDNQGEHNITSVKAAIIRDKTDSIFLPSQGDIFEISYEQTGALGGDYDFGRLEASYARYFTAHIDALDRKSILAFRARGGVIFGDAPFFERYYAGGISTIHGFDFRGVSPRTLADPLVLTSDRVAVGSDWLVLAGAEYSFPLVGDNLRAAAFLDTAAIDDGPYRVSAGLSIRLMVPYLAPLPLSADFAWPLTKDDDDDTRVFSFSFATMFR